MSQPQFPQSTQNGPWVPQLVPAPSNPPAPQPVQAAPAPAPAALPTYDPALYTLTPIQAPAPQPMQPPHHYEQQFSTQQPAYPPHPDTLKYAENARAAYAPPPPAPAPQYAAAPVSATPAPQLAQYAPAAPAPPAPQPVQYAPAPVPQQPAPLQPLLTAPGQAGTALPHWTQIDNAQLQAMPQTAQDAIVGQMVAEEKQRQATRVVLLN